MKRPLIALVAMLAAGLVAATASAQNPDVVLSIDGPPEGSIGGMLVASTDLDNTGPTGIAGWSWGVCQSSSLLVVTAVEDGETTLTVNGGVPPAFNAPAILPDGWTVGVVINFFGDNPLPPGTGYELHLATYDLLAEGTGMLEYCDTLGSPPVETTLVDSNGASIQPTTTSYKVIIAAGPDPFRYDAGGAYTVNYSPDTGEGSFSASLGIEEDPQAPGFPNDTQGFSFALGHDSSLLAATSVDPLPALGDLDGGMGPDFFGPALLADGITLGVVYEFLGGIFVQFDGLVEVVSVSYDTNAATLMGDMDGESTDLLWLDNVLGDPPVENVVVVGGLSQNVDFTDAMVDLVPVSDTPFRRGDCNDDSIVNIADGIHILNRLFQGQAALGDCEEACNANDDGMLLDASDAIYVFMYRFLDGPQPPAPFPDCGVEVGADCDSYGGCP